MGSKITVPLYCSEGVEKLRVDLSIKSVLSVKMPFHATPLPPGIQLIPMQRSTLTAIEESVPYKANSHLVTEFFSGHLFSFMNL